jgi:enamine deaminase RidA (YjgF/YER057c/UK114 family)
LKQQRSNPQVLAKLAASAHFSSAVRVGDMIWVSGTVGATPEGRPVEGMAAQAKLAFETLDAVLTEAGASLADVVELVTFHTDLRGDMRAFSKAKDAVFPTDFPAWTAVGVTQLAIEGLLVEIRAVAVVGSGQAAGIA